MWLAARVMDVDVMTAQASSHNWRGKNCPHRKPNSGRSQHTGQETNSDVPSIRCAAASGGIPPKHERDQRQNRVNGQALAAVLRDASIRRGRDVRRPGRSQLLLDGP
jgi:hypothetical protein